MKKLTFLFLMVCSCLTLYTQSYTFDTIITGIRNPTVFDFFPNGNIILNQKDDSVKIFTINNQLISCFWNFDDSAGLNLEIGLIGVCLDPNYSVNKHVYFYYHHGLGNPYQLRVVRLTDVNYKGTDPLIIFKDTTMAGGHIAGNIHFGPDGKLYITIGDNVINQMNAQSLTSPKGKILRINSDGSAPADNPFYDDGNPMTGNDDRIWAMGFRNSFDFTFNPFNDSIYATENGNAANDEINYIRKGKNYGWPICRGFCVPPNPLYQQPMDTIWGPGSNNYAPTGILIYNGDKMPELVGKLLVTGVGYGTYKGIIKYELGNAPVYDIFISHSVISPLHFATCIKQGSDGYIYIAQNAPVARILRMKHSTVGINDPSIPLDCSLEQNFPNPFNPVTTIKYSVPKQTFVTLQIYDALGRELSTLVNENKQAGNYQVNWNAENYPSGVYFYKFAAGEFTEQKKMVLIK